MEVSCLCLLREGSLERDTQVYNLVREMELPKTKKILVYNSVRTFNCEDQALFMSLEMTTHQIIPKNSNLKFNCNYT